MFCTGCSTTKESEKFYSVEHGRFLAYCSDCRAAIKAHGPLADLRAAEKPKVPPRLHRPVHRSPPAVGFPCSEPNIRLIYDPWIAHDLAWFFELNPSIGASNAGNR